MEDQEHRVEVPCYFLCPISMQLMKDPVTISTGITYDRANIEKWLYSCKNPTCPVTKQPLISATDLTPNHTLRRLIQAWCTLNALDRIPTPKSSFDKSQILSLLNEAATSPTSRLSCLHRLRSFLQTDESSRIHFHGTGAVHFLLSIVSKTDQDPVSMAEALSILQELELSESDLKPFVNGGILDSLIQVLENGSHQSRAQAIALIRSAFSVSDPAHIIGSKPELFTQTVRMLSDRISPQATKAALKLLAELCPWGRNRIKAAEAGAVYALVELLLEPTDRRTAELALMVLDQLCGCAEGRAELLRHGAGLAVVSKRILRVSRVASEKAVRILGWISKHSANARVLQEMLQVGVVSKLCLVLQIEECKKTKEKAKDILRLHSRVWKDSSCIPPHLLSSYPSSS